MRHRHINNRHTFGMLLNRPGGGSVSVQEEKPAASPAAHVSTEECVTVETAKRRHALLHGVPSSYWRLRHHHGYVMARPM